MAKYTPHTDVDVKAMLGEIGLNNLDDLYSDVPKSIVCDKPLNIGSGKSQMATERELEEIARENIRFKTIFRGAGAYDHYIPATVSAITAKEEFVTAYTPYQPEISQGILQSIFEYQSLMCRLTGMPVSNASIYDVGAAAGECINVCCEKKNTVLVAKTLNPRIIDVIKTYAFASNRKVVMVDSKDCVIDIEDLKAKLTDDVACVYAQSPNYYGAIESMDDICKAAHDNKSKFVYVFNPIALALLKTPAETGADIAIGEGQPLGMPLNYGGPYLGIYTCTDELKRRMPGRVVGATVDNRGNTVYVLTMQAREQHIRREKALSSICSNQALCALTASVYLTTLGKEGFKEVATQCAAKAHYLADGLSKIKGVSIVFKNEFFNEFTIKTDLYTAKLQKKLEDIGILGGLPLGDGLSIWCATEKATREQMDRVIAEFKEAANVGI